MTTFQTYWPQLQRRWAVIQERLQAAPAGPQAARLIAACQTRMTAMLNAPDTVEEAEARSLYRALGRAMKALE